MVTTVVKGELETTNRAEPGDFIAVGNAGRSIEIVDSWLYISQGEQYIIWADVGSDKLNLEVGPRDVDPTVF